MLPSPEIDQPGELELSPTSSILAFCCKPVRSRAFACGPAYSPETSTRRTYLIFPRRRCRLGAVVLGQQLRLALAALGVADAVNPRVVDQEQAARHVAPWLLSAHDDWTDPMSLAQPIVESMNRHPVDACEPLALGAYLLPLPCPANCTSTCGAHIDDRQEAHRRRCIVACGLCRKSKPGSSLVLDALHPLLHHATDLEG